MDRPAPNPILRVGILTAGLTEPYAPYTTALGIAFRADLPLPPHPVDAGLAPFFQFFQRILRPTGSRAEFYLLGNIHEPEFPAAVDQMAGFAVDMILWWTLSLPPARNSTLPDPALDAAVLRAASSGVTVVYPCFSGPDVDSPQMFRVGGLAIDNRHLALCPAPSLAALLPPKLVSWGDWETCKKTWIFAGFNDGLPDASPNMNEHSLATWTVASYLATIRSRSPRETAAANLARAWPALCIPIETGPPGASSPALYFDPRHVQQYGK